MSKEMKTCPKCQTKQVVEEDPNYPPDLAVMGSNNAGLKIMTHKTPTGEVCAGSGYTFQ